MKWLAALLLLLLAGLQYRLWVGEGSLAHVAQLERQIDKQQAENRALRQRNRVLALEVEALKAGADSVEARARADMGMIKKGETFYRVPETEK